MLLMMMMMVWMTLIKIVLNDDCLSLSLCKVNHYYLVMPSIQWTETIFLGDIVSAAMVRYCP